MNNIFDNSADVIVVGSGPSGVSCAYWLKKNLPQKKILLIERSNLSGEKNVFGGAMYAHALKEVFGDFLDKNPPIERIIQKHQYFFNYKQDSVNLSYQNFDLNLHNYDFSFSTLRYKFDDWCVQLAKDIGVYFIPNTLVQSLIVENGFVVGINTHLEQYRAKVVVIADGVNSLLAKQLKLRDELTPKDIILTVKEVIQLDEKTINERFLLENSQQGVQFEIFGKPFYNIFGMGFLYLNKDSIALGVGLNLQDLCNEQKSANHYLEQLKNIPYIKKYIENGSLIEYSAHLIAEGGYSNLPTLYSNGALLVGEAARLINNLHFEGTNLALISGKLAAQTIIHAFEKNDFSHNTLKLYKKLLENSFILKDLKAFQHVMPEIYSRKKSFLMYYVQYINKLMENFTKANGKPKKDSLLQFFKNFFSKRPIKELYYDIISLLKILIGLFK